MSADNGIYIAKFDSGFIRVTYASAIENVTYHPKGSEEELDTLKDYFGNSPLFKDEKNAVLYAHNQASKYEYLEYGVSTLSGIFPEFDPEVLAKDLAEIEPEYNHEWFHLRNIKPTEMQLFAGDKRICNIQGKWSEELEEFIRMANLGIVVHREEIKRRIEDMLEYDPKEVAFGRGENPTIQLIDDSPFAGVVSPDEFVANAT